MSRFAPRSAQECYASIASSENFRASGGVYRNHPLSGTAYIRVRFGACDIHFFIHEEDLSNVKTFTGAAGFYLSLTVRVISTVKRRGGVLGFNYGLPHVHETFSVHSFGSLLAEMDSRLRNIRAGVFPAR